MTEQTDPNVTQQESEPVYALTTLDNPYNPFDQFDEWYNYDTLRGYNTCGYIARIAKTSDEMSEEQEQYWISQAIDDILEFNVTGNYIKVTKESFSERFKNIIGK
jgi:hypothetical protein